MIFQETEALHITALTDARDLNVVRDKLLGWYCTGAAPAGFAVPSLAPPPLPNGAIP